MINSLQEYSVKNNEDCRKIIVEFVQNFLGNLAVPEIKMHIHSALAAVPERYHINMIYHPKFRCTYVRIFLPVLRIIGSI